ncbi:MAG: LytTR family DNA-binding domain-containing protein [Sphingomicrobium sp.]
MTPLRVMIIDDEPLASERLGDLLARIDGVELVATFQSGAEAIEQVPGVRPDLILIDIEMPKIDGFDFVDALAKQGWLDAASAPCICFVTAYPQFASAAFETGALDFLCKPVRLGRLERTIARARTALAQRAALDRLHELTRQLDALRETRAPTVEPSLWVHQRGQMVRIAIETLDRVQAEGEYVRLHVRDQSFLLRGSISAIAERLAGHGFVRIHRSTVINHARLSAIQSSRAGVKAVLADGAALPVGRKYRAIVRDLQDRGGEQPGGPLAPGN